MISAISHAPPPQPVTRTTETARRPTPSKPEQPARYEDKVELSPTAKAALAAMQKEDDQPQRPNR
jgi:hypothetical protein